MKATIYHNPRCSKSRQTLQLLQDRNIEVTIIEYLKTPPDKKCLQNILNQLAYKPIDLIRKKETLFKQLKLADHISDEHALLSAMVANPILIERPIVVANGKAKVGRPPEAVLDIL